MPRRPFTPMEREAQRRASRRSVHERITGVPEQPLVGTNHWWLHETQQFRNTVAQIYSVNPHIFDYSGTIGQTDIGYYRESWERQHWPTTSAAILWPQQTAAPTYLPSRWLVTRYFHNFDEIHEHFRSAVQELETAVTSRYGEDVWRNWTVTGTQRAADDGWIFELRADRHGRNEEPRCVWNQVWEDWVRGVPIPRPTQAMIPPRPSQAEIRRQEHEVERRRLIIRNRNRAATLRQKVAARRARELLLSMLTEEQQADLERANYFEVITPAGNRYQVAKGYAGNVYLVDEEGRRSERYCIHARENLPDEDHMLSQKLLLETDEREFRAVANMTRLYY